MGQERELLKLVKAGVLEIDKKGRIWKDRHGERVRAECVNGPRLKVLVKKNGAKLQAQAHNLVYMHHSGQPIPPDKRVVAKDGDRTNNTPSNLKLVNKGRRVQSKATVKPGKKKPVRKKKIAGSAYKKTMKSAGGILVPGPDTGTVEPGDELARNIEQLVFAVCEAWADRIEVMAEERAAAIVKNAGDRIKATVARIGEVVLENQADVAKLKYGLGIS